MPATERYTSRIPSSPQILQLKPGRKALAVWVEDQQFQPPSGAGLDGIAIGGDGNIYVNTFNGGEFFRVADGVGTPVGADLSSGTWLWGDGSLAAITETIRNGVLEPKERPGAMPPMGGVQLSDENLQAVAAYVWSLGHKGEKN